MPARARRKADDPNSPHPDRVGQSPHSTTLLTDGKLCVGIFRCPADSPQWDTENWIGPFGNVVFPRVPVRIHQRGHRAAVGDASTVALYLPDQLYTRKVLSPRGDECEWFAFTPRDFLDAAADAGLLPSAEGAARLPLTLARCSSRVYLLQRRLMNEITARTVDPFDARERAYGILALVMREAAAMNPDAPARRRRADTTDAHREIAEAVRIELSRRFREHLTVDELARTVHCSPFHLCRVFRAVVGSTVHDLLTDLRLRAALERVGDSRDDLSFIAADCGFSSAAHFSTAFRRAFNVPPSALRREWLRLPHRR